VRSAEWSDVPGHPSGRYQTATCSFELPTASDLIFFLSRGPFSNGHVKISQAEEGTKDVKVDVTVLYRDRGLLEQNVKVCQVQGSDEDSNGVGIFVSPTLSSSRMVRGILTVS
jgi:hypothetical protein